LLLSVRCCWGALYFLAILFVVGWGCAHACRVNCIRGEGPAYVGANSDGDVSWRRGAHRQLPGHVERTPPELALSGRRLDQVFAGGGRSDRLRLRSRRDGARGRCAQRRSALDRAQPRQRPRQLTRGRCGQRLRLRWARACLRRPDRRSALEGFHGGARRLVASGRGRPCDRRRPSLDVVGAGCGDWRATLDAPHRSVPISWPAGQSARPGRDGIIAGGGGWHHLCDGGWPAACPGGRDWAAEMVG
jgi:hypothetical protein